ncbi:STT3 domain-containing protein [Helicobacter turcicus]|uniref:General glycosylation pathway protein n=1 Tax=Helicobacter turcicus TaxID=2867412 RepID=A0ABS7JKG4_9HELI|nr:STT3 domain-containing protein [Helicobacter turcicus]MBX7489887.1 general glycosylation pathway protein [Helicobacter turcicus]MBX7544747.1 general glycosylation pathway protein [Helicobacter turcicus]
MSIRVYLLTSVCIYALCVTLRFYYPFVLESYPQYLHNNTWLLNTHDGYFYAQGAKDILHFLESFLDSNTFASALNFVQNFTLDSNFKSTLNSPTHEPLSIITALIAFLTPLSLEQVLFYLPGFLGALIVFPMLYITRHFGIVPAILASLLSALSISYFNRTIFGYYDTDMLILPLALSVLALTLSKNVCAFGFLFALSVFSLLYYPNLRYVFLSFIAILLCFKSKRETAAILMLAIPFALFLPFSLFGAVVWITISVILNVFKIPPKLFWIILSAFVFFMLYVLLPSLLHTPFFSTLFMDSQNTQPLPFLNVLDSIAETSKISFNTFAVRVSGNLALFILSLVGYGYLVYKKRVFLLFLPLLLLGAFSLLQGLRFSFYSSPVSALGLSYLLYQSTLLKKIPLRPLFQTFFILLTLYPHLLHIKNYTPKPILDFTEAQILKAIPSKKGDSALAWWDYGYMINYFSNLNVFIDGGKHSGKQNFPVSLFFASSDNDLSYNIAKSLLNGSMESHFKTPSFLESLLHYKPQDHAQNLYIILPLSMLEIFPNVIAFSNFNKTPKFFALSQNVESKNANSKIVHFKNKLALDLKNGILNPNTHKISKFISLKTNKTLNFNPQSPLSALELQDGRILLCDNSYLESFYFQGLFFETLNPNLFQKMLKNDKITIYKLL